MPPRETLLDQARRVLDHHRQERRQAAANRPAQPPPAAAASIKAPAKPVPLSPQEPAANYRQESIGKNL